MKKNAKVAVLFCIPLAALPVAQHVKAYVATQRLRDLWVRQGLMEPEQLQQLIQQGADVNVRNRSGLPILHYAATCGPALTKAVLDQGADVNAQDNYGNTALTSAVTAPNSETVQLLLSRGANPNLQAHSAITSVRKPGKNITALSWAQEGAALSNVSDEERMNSLRIIRLLKAAGAKE